MEFDNLEKKNWNLRNFENKTWKNLGFRKKKLKISLKPGIQTMFLPESNEISIRYGKSIKQDCQKT